MKLSDLKESVLIKDFEPFMNDSDYVKSMYNKASKYPVYKQLSNALTVHINETSSTVSFFTVDNIRKELVHKSVFEIRPMDKLIPFKHAIQYEVAKQSDVKFPSGFIPNLMLEFIDKIGIPLVSSPQQTVDGKKLWQRIIPLAFSKGYKIRFVQGGKSYLISNQESLDSALSNYHGSSNKFSSKFLAVFPK